MLQAPPERMQVKRFDDVRALEGIALDLITEYAARVLATPAPAVGTRPDRGRHAGRERSNNIREYRLSIDAAETRLIEDVQIWRTISGPATATT